MVRAIAHDTIKNDVDYSASLYGSCYSPLHLQCFLIWFVLLTLRHSEAVHVVAWFNSIHCAPDMKWMISVRRQKPSLNVCH